jgi:cobalt-zinc-cadmium efflux system outer membrane protein
MRFYALVNCKLYSFATRLIKKNSIVMLVNKLCTYFIFTLISINLFSQDTFKDTLKISLQQADSIFIVRNLSLLSEKCNVDASKAQIIQAKLFQNPSVTINQNIVNTEYKTNGGHKWFDYTNKGETSIQIDKLFLLAGKRNKQIKLAELTAGKEGHLYFDLVRTLKYSLHSSFFDIYYINRILEVYDMEIASLTKLISVSEDQYKKEYISKKELLRLKATLFSLENEKLDYTSQLITILADLNLLMHTSNIFYLPQPNLIVFNNFSADNLKLQSLIDTALISRYDLKMAQSDLNISQMNLAYQKAMAIPDITISGGWDRNGSYVHNYNYIGLQTALPLFNRNQGNIKSAIFIAESSKYNLESAEDQVKADVVSAYANALETNRLYERFDKQFINDLDMLAREMLKNFEKRNISLIEFIDYFDAYKQNAVQFNKLLYNRISAIENINYSVGKEVIKQP